MSEWTMKTLDEVVELRRGFDLPHRERRPGPYPVLTAGVSAGSHDEGPIKGPGFVVGRATNLGVPTWSDTDYWPLNTTLYAADFKGNDPKYLFHLFETLDLAGYDSGSVQPMLNRNYIAQIEVAIAPLDHQRAIAEVLGAFDDKIAANTKLGSLLGKHVDASFASIVGPWRNRVALGDLVSITKGVSYRSVDLVPSSTALVTLKSIQRGGSYSPRGLKAFAGAFNQAQQIRTGEIIVAQTDLTQAADVVGRAVRVPASSGFGTLVASLDIAIVRPIRGVETEFVLGVMRDRRFIEHCKSRTSGTTVLHLAKDAIQSFLAPEVPLDLQKRYAAAAGPAHHMRDAAARESEVLSTTRDALLPLLMSGRIRIKDAEQMVGDVV